MNSSYCLGIQDGREHDRCDGSRDAAGGHRFARPLSGLIWVNEAVFECREYSGGITIEGFFPATAMPDSDW
jgi:hypothetical protein